MPAYCMILDYASVFSLSVFLSPSSLSLHAASSCYLGQPAGTGHTAPRRQSGAGGAGSSIPDDPFSGVLRHQDTNWRGDQATGRTNR